MPPAGFEPAIPASERPQTHALDRAANGIGSSSLLGQNIFLSAKFSATCFYSMFVKYENIAEPI
jgi:hypothetical protein